MNFIIKVYSLTILGGMKKDKFEIVKFVDDEFELDVRADKLNDTVWLTQDEKAELFGVDRTRITRHINNVYNEGELDKNSTCAENAHMGTLGVQRYLYKLYNLDVIISVGYRVKSQRGVVFRTWANRILKEYLIQGNGYGDMVIMSLKTYEEKLERIEMYEAILEGLSNEKDGKVANGPKALKKLKTKYDL
jgi:hypothetical protein